jgi:hypothetical protein
VKPGILGVGKDAQVLLTFPGQPGDVLDLMAEQHVPQGRDELNSGVFIDEDTHHAARVAGS